MIFCKAFQKSIKLQLFIVIASQKLELNISSWILINEFCNNSWTLEDWSWRCDWNVESCYNKIYDVYGVHNALVGDFPLIFCGGVDVRLGRGGDLLKNILLMPKSSQKQSLTPFFLCFMHERFLVEF